MTESRVLIWVSLGGILTICGTVFTVGMWVKGTEKDAEIAAMDRQSIREDMARQSKNIEALTSTVTDLTKIVGNGAISNATQAQRIDNILERVANLERREQKGTLR